jgi:gamma-glutamyltranspeptidase/glutathione hydrolase
MIRRQGGAVADKRLRRGAFMRSWIFGIALALAACGRPDAVGAADSQTLRTSADARGLVVAAHPLATEAGVEILRAGGSAVDAAIAVEAVLSLVEPQSSGLGGGGFLLHYDAQTGAVTAYDGREVAPMDATPELFLNADGEPLGFLEAKNSGLSIGVPGVVDMLALAHDDLGRLDWSTLFEPARRHATDGFPVGERLNGLIGFAANFGLKASPATERYFFTRDGRPLPVGATLRNPDYARSLAAIAADPRALYEGPLAAAVVEAARAGDNGGTLSLEDMAAYRARKLQPVCADYRGYAVCGPPPPSAGGVAVNEVMGVLGRFALAEGGAADPTNWALFADAQRLAYADWGAHIGDDRFVPVPITGLLSDGYLDQRAALVAAARPLRSAPPGDPWPFEPDAEPANLGEDATVDAPGTSHFVIVDDEGDVVSMTASVESAFGSTRMAGGMILNNQLTDFSFRPTDRAGRPAANAVAPGKAPRSSMAPTIVLDADGGFLFATGSPGGASIIAYTAKTLIGVLDWGLTPQEAIDLPNMVARGDTVRVESARALPGLIEGLRAQGYDVQESSGETSGLHAVLRHPDGSLEAGVDPRREGVALVP